MKTIHALLIAATICFGASGQNIDSDRMKRDIEVAENVLATLIKQELDQQGTFFGLDVRGSYQPGYGVTFRVPSEQSLPFVISITGDDSGDATIVSNGATYRYSYRRSVDGAEDNTREVTLADQTREKRETRADSTRTAFSDRIIRAAQTFILDYGDLISQLTADDRIVVTNQGDRIQYYFNNGSKSRISVEGKRADIAAFRQGTLTRDQALKRLAVVNAERLDKIEPDLEMLSSIFSRLYRPDLSKTYFMDGNVYYERLRDFGAVYYMRVVSSNETSPNRFTLPTLGLKDLDQAARDKEVAALYPAFEEDVKENLLEYGRTVKSLGDDESLILNITLTKCTGCGIPGTLELSVKASVLKGFGSGKIDKSAALSRVAVKKGEMQ